ncbi:MAG: 3-phosphoshikimate 1-carboxyvinyltransferase [Verrucomicrobiia bacterium]
MPLPDLIEIVPLDKPVRAEITVPGSKSITNRALILAALADGEVTLQGALWSEDTQVMTEALQKLGFQIRVEPDPEEFCNRTIMVKGLGGKIPNAGTAEKPLELFVGNAGTAARFLAAFVCLGDGVYRLSGVARMHERPQAALFKALRELGYRVEAEQGNDKLPATIVGGSSRGNEAPSEKSEIRNPKSESDQSLLTSAATKEKKCRVSIEESSQFASALLLCAKHGGWTVKVVGENAEESPYVAMTSKMIEAFPHYGGKFPIEPDASSGSYFLAAEKFVKQPEFLEYSEQFGVPVKTQLLRTIRINYWPRSGWQIDEKFDGILLLTASLHMGLELERDGEPIEEKLQKTLRESSAKDEISREEDLGDSIMIAIVLSPFSINSIKFTDLGRLRVQETERVVALRTELTKCGAKVIEEGDTLTVWPSQLHGAEIETYNDHRMAMCFSVLGLKVPGIKIKNPACVKKTFPNFFQKLATPPPKGLGATILDAKTGRKLGVEELFAD